MPELQADACMVMERTMSFPATPEDVQRRLEEIMRDAKGPISGVVIVKARSQWGDPDEKETRLSFDVPAMSALHDLPGKLLRNEKTAKSNATVHQPSPGVILFRLQGRFDGGDCGEVRLFEDALKEAILEAKASVAILNCGQSDCYCSDGIFPPLMKVWTTLKKKSDRLLLSNVPEGFLELLQITKLDKLFKILETEQEALAKSRQLVGQDFSI